MKNFYKNALVSVSDKTGVAAAVRGLAEGGARVVSTGGTARFLKEQNLPVVLVEEQTSFPEVLGGRVKTLHPHIFLPLLARLSSAEDAEELKKRNLEPFDVLICNLYPFESALEKNEKNQIEWVDVGGPSMLRAAAKNFETITVICDPKDYSFLEKPASLEERKFLAGKVFSYLSAYDAMIADWLSAGKNFEQNYTLSGSFFKKLRYGENPRQKSAWYRLAGKKRGLERAKVFQGKELSFNNLRDIQAGVDVSREFSSTPCFVGIKHTNPCGTAIGETLFSAVKKGIQADPVSIFGGIVVLNRRVCLESAKQLSSLFLECITAPSFEPSALDFLSKKKNLRVLAWDFFLEQGKNDWSVYNLDGGFLIQDRDEVLINWDEYKIYGSQPSEEIKKDLETAWRVSAHLKSNAVCLVSGGQTVGMGMGQVDRVSAVEQAFQRMKKNHKNIKTPVVMASDGFFPFSDSIERAALEGVRWVIQPGGSIRDQQIIEKAARLEVSLVLTGRRHFKH